jgi:hypothetical protein
MPGILSIDSWPHIDLWIQKGSLTLWLSHATQLLILRERSGSPDQQGHDTESPGTAKQLMDF